MKTQTLLRSIFGTAFIAVLLFVVSCDAANNPSALVGRWVGVSAGKDEGVVLELLSDGTGVVSKDTKGSGGYAITWKTEKDRFYITFSGQAQAESYKLQGSVLTFTEDDGKISEYMKCKKDCKEAVAEYAKAEAKAKADKTAAALKAIKKSSFTDSRDGKTYKTVKLDNQTWMAENLNYNADGSKCYENQESNCQKYGRLYNWETAKLACPKSWHLPSDAEWQTLVNLAGGDKVAGNVLKASSGWNSNKGKSGNGVDAAGFSALPGGIGKPDDGGFDYVGSIGIWWSSEGDSALAYGRSMGSHHESVFYDYNDKDSLFSVRCVQD